MEIRIPKPSCPECGSKNIRIYSSDGVFECNNCGGYYIIDIIWEEDQTFCNCEICKQLNLIKDEV